ncbi:MAG: lipid A export permease/ATP-binding protein MsbA [Neisseriaceae bacterium]|nr:lipid A export permease/ATP-binding protein MsbA [Neisseriaceae bacterium]MBP6860862.1 lipid A export permease/ATP-binding protein MsbA [Neisseriaceae bacterium]
MSQVKFQSSFELYKRLFKYLRGYWKVFSVSIVAMVVAASTEPAFVALLKPLIDEGFVAKNISAMNWIPLAIIGLFVLRGITSFINEYTSSYLSGHLVQQLRQELFAKLLMLPVGYYQNNQSGRLVSRITNDVSLISEAGFRVITVTVKDGITVIGLLGLLLYTDWQLTLITLGVMPIVTLCVKFVNKRLRGLSRKNQQDMGEMTQVLNESIDCARMVKVYGGEVREQERFRGASVAVRHNLVKQTTMSSLSTGVTQLIIACALSAILYFAAQRARNNAFSAGDFMSFLSGMLMLFAPVKRITNITQALQRGLAAAESVFGFLDEKSEPDHGRQTFPGLKKSLSFNDVVFRYEGAEKDSLKGVSLDIKAGSMVALVGASGCGKSTLVSLIPRFYNPTSGQVRVDGVDVADYTLRSLRRDIAVVSQDVVLFNDTIAHNIAYGKLGEVSEAEIIAAAKAANAYEFIEQLPQGLNTLIGENGTKLSGGQRQRLAIARALLKNAPILILDEATSALDTASERLVQAALENLMQDRTTIVIAHRLSTIEKADTIVVMHDGQIAEQGTHSDLLALGARYANLYQMQFKDGAKPGSDADSSPV